MTEIAILLLLLPCLRLAIVTPVADYSAMKKRQIPETPFTRWIADVGAHEASRVLGVPLRRVRTWRYLERQPRLEDVPELVRRSRGALTLESFFGPEQLKKMEDEQDERRSA